MFKGQNSLKNGKMGIFRVIFGVFEAKIGDFGDFWEKPKEKRGPQAPFPSERKVPDALTLSGDQGSQHRPRHRSRTSPLRGSDHPVDVLASGAPVNVDLIAVLVVANSHRLNRGSTPGLVSPILGEEMEVHLPAKGQNSILIVRKTPAKQNAGQLLPDHIHNAALDSLEELLDLDNGAVMDVELGQDPVKAQLCQVRLGFGHLIDGIAIRGVVEEANLDVLLLNHRWYGAFEIPLMHGVHFRPFSRADFLDTKVFLWELSQ